MSVFTPSSQLSSRSELALRVTQLLQQAAKPATTSLTLASQLRLTLDLWQRRLLTSSSKQILLNVSRQGGKSTISALKGLDVAMSKRSLVLIISPGERQSKLLFKKVLRFYDDLGRPVPALTVNKLSLELANGSEIHALPGEEGTIRGFSAVDLMLVDEASRVDDTMMAAIRPMLAVSGGTLIAMSTPWGKRGWWYEAWENGAADDWERILVTAEDIPRITSAFLDRERRSLPDPWFRSEYMCEFVEPDNALFTYEQIQRAFSFDVETLFDVAEGEEVESLW